MEDAVAVADIAAGSAASEVATRDVTVLVRVGAGGTGASRRNLKASAMAFLSPNTSQ